MYTYNYIAITEVQLLMYRSSRLQPLSQLHKSRVLN